MARVTKPRSFRRVWEFGWVGAFVLAGVGVALAYNPVPTTVNDFFEPGTQPNTIVDPLVSASQCAFCHSDYNEEWAPWNRWTHSMMGQAMRDPIFRAGLVIANQDAVDAGEACIRCHAPAGWLAGRSSPSNGSALTVEDQQGVSCSICHRMVDPVYTAGVDPTDDPAILAAINPPALSNPHNGAYVIDPRDNRRGPFDLQADWLPTVYEGWPGFHEYRQSPFHTSSLLCATCHDVSLPHFSKQPDGTYALNALNTPGPTDKYQNYPEQRTYSEWAKSLFAQGPVDLAGRFGGANGPMVSTCQDCHMPGVVGQGCALDPPTRPTAPGALALPQHNFSGANSWVLRAIRSIYFDSESGLNEVGVEEAIARNVAMLKAASDLAVTKVGSNVNVRITNYTGHKLPTGYPEGRRMWINVQFKNANDVVIAEHGAYDPYSIAPVLDELSTKVYERVSGISAATAAFTGQPAGPSNHLVLNSEIYKDNRIPPMGYNQVQFTSVQAEPVPANLYADGQYWDDTQFAIPAGARSVKVNIYHQTTTYEYASFLKAGTGNTGAGLLAFNLWDTYGRDPVLMDSASLPLGCACDWNNSGALSVQDIFDFLTSYFSGSADINNSGSTTVQDIFDFLSCYFTGCA